jgi:hypothetical protein
MPPAKKFIFFLEWRQTSVSAAIFQGAVDTPGTSGRLILSNNYCGKHCYNQPFLISAPNTGLALPKSPLSKYIHQNQAELPDALPLRRHPASNGLSMASTAFGAEPFV